VSQRGTGQINGNARPAKPVQSGNPINDSARDPSAPGVKSSQDQPILFQQFFKSVGPRTYVAQVKQAGNGNHYLVLTEANRKKDSDEIRKTRLFIFSEDFAAFHDLLRDAKNFTERNPVSAEVAKKQNQYWQKKSRPPKR